MVDVNYSSPACSDTIYGVVIVFNIKNILFRENLKFLISNIHFGVILEYRTDCR